MLKCSHSLHVIHCDDIQVARCRKQGYRFQTRRCAIFRVGTGCEGIGKVVFTPVLESEVTNT